MYSERMEICKRYIEEHLGERLTAVGLADVAGYSFYHFCHLFPVYTGCTVAGYIRIRRMERAAELLLEGTSVTETALACGFETPSGFTKAFQRHYGIAPREYRKTKAAEDPRMTSETGGNSMKYERKACEAMTVIGYKFAAPEGDFWFHDSAAYWYGQDYSAVSGEEYAKLCEGSCGEIGVWLDPAEEDGAFSYFFGPVVAAETEAPAGLAKITIPAADYAVFAVPAGEGPEQIRDNVRACWKEIFAFFEADTEPVKPSIAGDIFEMYTKEGTFIYVPVVEK